MTEREMDVQLKQMYARWLSEMRETVPEFLDSQEYSNPYYTAVPKWWCASNVRILIVGQEGHGDWGMGRSEGVKADEIQRIQECNWALLAGSLGYDLSYDLYPVEWSRKINSYFWTRVKKLNKYGVCAWTNQDTIHVLSDNRDRNECPLKDEERSKLHSVDTKMLAEEIRILSPTHVVLCGWYGLTIQSELPELFSELYPNGIGDNSVWKNKVVHREIDGIHYIAAYHPNWGHFRKGYEAEVISVFENTLK